MDVNRRTKDAVLARIANGNPFLPAQGKGRSKWVILNNIVHVRFRSDPKGDGVTFAYNVNPNTLSSDFELWICGNEQVYYLIPITEIKEIYNDPEAYIDYQHLEIRVADINTRTHQVLYSRSGNLLNFSSYYRSVLH